MNVLKVVIWHFYRFRYVLKIILAKFQTDWALLSRARGRVEVEGRIFRVDESEIQGRGSKVEVEGRNIFELIFKFLKNFDF